MELLELKKEEQAKVLEVMDMNQDDTLDALEREDWILLTDEEADQKTKEYIQESLWAFTPSFLADATDIDQAVFEAIQANDRCENNNPAIAARVESTCGIDELVKMAVMYDGRGHFIAFYDHEEHEIGSDTYLYRLN